MLNLKEESTNKENYRVEVGLRPSGLIYLGNIMTPTIASWLIHQIGTHKSKLNVTICDIDTQGVDGNSLIPYNHLPDEGGCHATFSDHNTEKIKDLVSLLSGELGIEYSFSKLSEIQKKEEYRKGIEDLIKTNSLREILGLSNFKHKKIPIFPLCSAYNTATKSFSQYDPEKK